MFVYESESAKYSKHLQKSITWSVCANGQNLNKKIYKERKKVTNLIGIEYFYSDGI